SPVFSRASSRDSADASAAGVTITASTETKASTSPAPNRSSRPGEPMSRAVFISVARTRRLWRGHTETDDLLALQLADQAGDLDPGDRLVADLQAEHAALGIDD